MRRKACQGRRVEVARGRLEPGVEPLEPGADGQVGEGDAEGGVGEQQVAEALPAGRRPHDPEDDQERHGGDDLGHHQRLVDEGVDRGPAAEAAHPHRGRAPPARRGASSRAPRPWR